MNWLGGGRTCVMLGVLLLASWWADAAHAQARPDLANRPVADIRVEGLDQVPQSLVLNQVRLSKGDPYDPKVVEEDIVRITYLGRFNTVAARVEPQPDGSVVLVYVVSEQPILADVRTVGNKQISDQELAEKILLRAGDPADPFLIDKAMRGIREAYEEKGYFVADVSVDEDLLRDSNILILQVREGPRVRIRQIRFEGNETFTDRQLRSRIRSNTYLFIFRRGSLSREMLELDAARLRDFYRDRGYLDAQVGRRIDLSPDQRNAVVTFVVSEGAQYVVDSVRIEGNELFPDAQIHQTLDIHPGDVFGADKVRRSQEALEDLYGKLGYIETLVVVDRLFHGDEPKVDLRVRIDEGQPYTVGKITIRGNQVTKDKVILRQLRGMTPGRPFDRTGVAVTERRLRESPLFSDGIVTILGDREDEQRDVLVEVSEQNTGSLSFGAGVSSDAGVVGAVDLVQRNFDLADYPESFGEFITGRSFRGAGQYFSLAIQPGNEYSRYAMTFREPYLLESDYFLDTSVFFFQRERESFDEERIGGSVGIGQRFGDVWSASIIARAEQVDIGSIFDRAPVDVFALEGTSLITSLGLNVTRDTTDSFIFPTRGSILNMGIRRAGLLGGDFDFTAVTADWRKFWTVDEDFFGRKTVLSLRVEAGYIFEENEAPFFERFYAGGHRSFRGFSFRGAGPRGIRNDTGRLGKDPVGGDWLFLLGLEYNFPIFEDIFRGVVFTDTGTVQDRFGFDEYRVAIGAGLRIRIPFLGQAPFALDFAIPIIKEDFDETRLISFDLAVPFR